MTPDEALAAAAVSKQMDTSGKSTETDLELTGLSTGVLVLLAALWSLLGHHLSSRSRYLNESGTACLLGLAAGVVLLACRDRANAGLVNGLLRFNSAAFFTYLLPPVIFYAGLSVEQRLFFRNLPSILSFGVLGTMVSFVLISAALYSLAGTTFGMDAQDCLALGAVFAATDSVAVLGLLDPRASPQLFSLVFGEGIVNDATSVVLLGALARVARQQQGGPDQGGMFVEDVGGSGAGGDAGPSLLQLTWRLTGNFGYLLVTSTLLGVAAGAGVAALLRHRVASQGPHHEVALVGLLSYLAYLAAEVLGLSAILSLFCCGAAVSHFALRNGAFSNPDASPLDRSAHGGGAGGGSGGRGSAVLANGDHRITNVDAAAVITAVSSDNPRHPDHQTDDGTRSWYGTYGMSAAADGAGDDGDDRRCDSDRGAGRAGVGQRVLWVLTAPAKRLAARAFGGGGGGSGSGSCMSAAGAACTINAFRSLSYVAEGLIFVYLGMDCLDPLRWEASYAGEVVWLVGVLLFFMLAARAASIIPLSMLHNLYAPRHQRLSGRDMLIIWWSGLMRGAVSVALVYLNFDTADGSRPAAAAIIAPRHTQGSPSPYPRGLADAVPAAVVVPGTGGGGRRRHLLLDAAAAVASAAAAAAAGGGDGGEGEVGNETAVASPDDAAAMALAAALAEANEVSSRQHATLIVATLLVVVASVLVVSTLTKPLLQAALEADPRKPPLKVLREALCDPWVDATWRLQVALGRSYRRWTTAGGAAGSAEEGESLLLANGGGCGSGTSTATAGGAGGPSAPSRRGVVPSSGTHTIPMATLGLGASSTAAAGTATAAATATTAAAATTPSSGAALVSGRSQSVGAVVPVPYQKGLIQGQLQQPGGGGASAVSGGEDHRAAAATGSSRTARGQLQQRSAHSTPAAGSAPVVLGAGAAGGPGGAVGTSQVQGSTPASSGLGSAATLQVRTGREGSSAASGAGGSLHDGKAAGALGGAGAGGTAGGGAQGAVERPRSRLTGGQRAGSVPCVPTGGLEYDTENDDPRDGDGRDKSGGGGGAGGGRGGGSS